MSDAVTVRWNLMWWETMYSGRLLLKEEVWLGMGGGGGGGTGIIGCCHQGVVALK